MPKVLLGSSCARMERHYENNDSADFERARDDIGHELYVWNTKDIQGLEQRISPLVVVWQKV